MEPSRKNRRLCLAAVAAIVCACAVAVAIFALTAQPPERTSAESGFVNDLLVSLFGDVPGLYDPQTELWLGIHVRHWAHTVEFGALGLFVAISALLVLRGRPAALAGACSLAICAVCSLVDQCHKLFVPGRHFDWFDLVMDALGYCTSIAIVLVIVAVVRRIMRAR